MFYALTSNIFSFLQCTCSFYTDTISLHNLQYNRYMMIAFFILLICSVISSVSSFSVTVFGGTGFVGSRVCKLLGTICAQDMLFNIM